MYLRMYFHTTGVQQLKNFDKDTTKPTKQTDSNEGDYTYWILGEGGGE